MHQFSEQELLKNCPHCDKNSFALKHPLKETERFWIVCDVHPLSKGHILIMPKKHISCIGEYDEEHFNEFIKVYELFSNFIKQVYGSVSSFEHGRIGQTVFHSHVQMLPFNGQLDQIIPEGELYLKNISTIGLLREEYNKSGKYLYFSIGKEQWIVDLKLGKPRFFRDRFALALHSPERGNWKNMHHDSELMKKALKDIEELKNSWKNFVT